MSAPKMKCMDTRKVAACCIAAKTQKSIEKTAGFMENTSTRNDPDMGLERPQILTDALSEATRKTASHIQPSMSTDWKIQGGKLSICKTVDVSKNHPAGMALFRPVGKGQPVRMPTLSIQVNQEVEVEVEIDIQAFLRYAAKHCLQSKTSHASLLGASVKAQVHSAKAASARTIELSPPTGMELVSLCEGRSEDDVLRAVAMLNQESSRANPASEERADEMAASF